MHTNSIPTLRVARVGAGMIGRAHARALRALEAILEPGRWRVELSVVADTDVGLAHLAQARWSIDRVVSSCRDVTEADDVDIACVGLPKLRVPECSRGADCRGETFCCARSD